MMKLYHLYIPILLYLLYSYFSTMLLSLIGLCVLTYILFYVFCTVYFDCDVETAFAEKFGKPISSLKGKVVFITGASSGIGEFTALSLAKRGVKLVLAARRKEELERVKTSCLEASNGQLSSEDILVLPMDVLKYSNHQVFFDTAVKHFGQVDVLMNNAGRSQRAHWENIDLVVDKDMFDLNVFAIINFSRIAVRYFQKENRAGHIVVTSSVVGVLVLPFSATYIGTKHALHGYFNCLRTEKVLNNISVSLLCPGPTFTNFLQNCFTENKGQAYGKSTSPTDKRMTAERCGELCSIAIANKLNESWMAVWPLIPIMYLDVYCPILFKILKKIVGPETLYKIRDSKDNLELPTAK